MADHLELGNREEAQLSFCRQTILCHTEAEAKAFLILNRHRVRDLQFIITGYQLHQAMFASVNNRAGLIFGRDLLGSLWDIKVAGWLNHFNIKILFCEDALFIRWRNEEYRFASNGVTLNAFERASGFRSGVRTYKPKGFTSFLEQLNNHHGTKI